MFGESICEAIPKIQRGRVAPLAEIVECLARNMRLLNSHRFYPDAGTAKKRIALLPDFGRKLTLKHD